MPKSKSGGAKLTKGDRAESARVERAWRLFDIGSIAYAIALIVLVSLGYMGIFDETTRRVFRYAAVVQIVFVVASGVRALMLLWRKRGESVPTSSNEISVTIFHYIALSVVLNLNSRELGLLRVPLINTGGQSEKDLNLVVDIRRSDQQPQPL